MNKETLIDPLGMLWIINNMYLDKHPAKLSTEAPVALLDIEEAFSHSKGNNELRKIPVNPDTEPE